MVHNKTKTEDLIKICKDKQVVYQDRFAKRNQTWVKYICLKHKELGIQERSFSKLKNSMFGCKECMKEYTRENGRNVFIKDITEKFKNEEINILNTYFDKKLQQRMFSFICNKHLQYGEQVHNMSNLDKIKTPCKYCSNNFRRTMEYFKEKLFDVNDTILVSGEYVNNKTNVNCECLICGSKWKATPDNLLNKHTGCPVCKKSKGELRIAKYLKSKSISFSAQYTFKDCKNIRPLPFDFYLLSYNILIEYQGSQHYIPTNFSDRNNIELANKMFKKLKHNDDIKYNYCIQHNIKLLQIPYWDFDKIEMILENELFRKETLIA